MEEAGNIMSAAVQESKAAYDSIQARFGSAVSEFDANPTMPFFEVSDLSKWVDIALFMRDDPRLKFNYLACLSGMDYPEQNQLGIVCNLESIGHHPHRIAVKVKCPRDGGAIPSVSCVWHTANWHEREAYDMYGMTFDGHPDHRRILCPEDWTGFPLRKDYQVQDTYHGIKVPY
ncbi:MAG: NADH-quinone oxidoreductase subunit C [Chlorobiaceae bacterium]|nr:NADH-quinone oxidoreductase subunit C [Chlorobiaceae bacterium]NTW74284.1 NADH-quinone oxidoreductase subunit C [Chlorobiaceae bacterium]